MYSKRMTFRAYLTIWVCSLNVFTMTWNYGIAGGGPVLLDRPFITVWNAPSQDCQQKYNVSLDLVAFDVDLNQNESFMGREMTLFYSNKLGYYPYYTENGTAVYGGVPQNASLKDHLRKAQQDIKETILEANFKGLAVIDWESWRPLWLRNWGIMDIYKKKSMALVKEKHPDWPIDKVMREAQIEFEQSSQAFMEQTLALGKTLRPGGFWGFYGFPNCYNYAYKNANYTAKCPEVEKQRNEELQWLWNQSQALYPSIYLPEKLRPINKTLEFVRSRVQETFRMVNRTGNGSTPVLPYASINYEFTQNFLSQEDLVHTIGESASQGAAGIILWGSNNYSCSQVYKQLNVETEIFNGKWYQEKELRDRFTPKVSLNYIPEACLDVKKYVDVLLGPYIVNVTCSTWLCSQALCSMHGRCVRQDSHPDVFLHLSPSSFVIKRHPLESRFLVMGQMSSAEQIKMAEEFRCQCYSGWEGSHCEKRSA